jgi:hypothetical protein
MLVVDNKQILSIVFGETYDHVTSNTDERMKRKLKDIAAKEFNFLHKESAYPIRDTIRSKEHHFATCNIDRALPIVNGVLPFVDGHGELKGTRAIMLVKLISDYNGYVWGDDTPLVPSWCGIEAQWCLGVCEVDCCVVVGLIGNERIIVRVVRRDEQAIKQLFEKAKKHVEKFII